MAGVVVGTAVVVTGTLVVDDVDTAVVGGVKRLAVMLADPGPVVTSVNVLKSFRAKAMCEYLASTRNERRRKTTRQHVSNLSVWEEVRI